MSPRYSNVTSSFCGYDYMICITQSHIHLFNQHIEPQRVPQDFYRRNKDENVQQPLCIDYPIVTSGIRELSAKTYIK